MAIDPELVSEASAWFAKAANDLRAAETVLDASPPMLAEAVFHCQQAAKKTLKGFLTWHGRPFRKTHNLEEIGGECLEMDLTLARADNRSGRPFTEYAWRFRYPGEPYEPAAEEAAEALTTARSVYQAVLRRVPAELHPSTSGK